MKREAILHIPMSNYAHGLEESKVLFRLRCARGDLKACRLYYGDRACRVTPVLFTGIMMTIAAQDEYFDYYELELTSPYNRICYYFELEDGVDQLLYYSDQFHHSTVDERSEYYQFPYHRREDIADVPDWAKDAIIYNIFPDSFATARRSISKTGSQLEYEGKTVKGKNGGTIQGITDNLDYLLKLGVNCIYINPFFVAGEYHKYDLIDYYHVDPCFGTEEEFKFLVDMCHNCSIRVIIDGVFNHCGWNFFAFTDVVERGEESKYKDWFYRLSFPVIKPDNGEDIPNYECFAYERLMPKMNTSNPEVVAYFCDVCQHWITEYGVDGWRLDVASEVNDEFWREFRRAAKEVKPDCFLIGEVWETAAHWLNGDQFDSSMNYDFRKYCRDFFAIQALDAFTFDARVTSMRMRYRKNMLYGQLNLLDSHDVSRFFSLCKERQERFKLSVLFQMTFIGPPSIFYGDELLLKGLKEEEYRSPMNWEDDSEEGMFAFYKAAIYLRKKIKALRRGDYSTLQAEQASRLYVFERWIEEEHIIIALNAGEQCEKLKIDMDHIQVIWQTGYTSGEISGYGFLIAKRN